MLIPKFNGSNVLLTKWEVRLESAVYLYQVPTHVITELAINSLWDDAHQAIMVLPEKEHASLEKKAARLEVLFGENVTLNVTLTEMRC